MKWGKTMKIMTEDEAQAFYNKIEIRRERLKRKLHSVNQTLEEKKCLNKFLPK